jgi:hypothetical protein
MAQNGSYSNGFHHGSVDNSNLQPSGVPAMNTGADVLNGSFGDSSNPELEGSSALDHALLESLFYNEMMMLNPSSPGSSTFLSQHFNEATHPRQQQQQQQQQQQHRPATVATGDPNTIAEKDLLRDFGVSSSPIEPSTHRHHPPQSWSAPPVHPQHLQSMAPTLAVPSSSAPKHVPIYPAPWAVLAYPADTYDPLATAAAAAAAATAASKPSAAMDRPPLSIDTSITAAAPQDHRAKQLVDQFATLASRLGIELPTNVLQSLTAAAAKNDPQPQQALPSNKPSSSTSHLSTPPLTFSSSHDLSPFKPNRLPDSSISPVATLTDDAEDSGPSTLQELRRTAEEAIASVTNNKRAAIDMDGGESSGGGSNSGNAKDGSKHASQQSKRKKKPRLADCESRLAELRAENELLKRHLENVSNKAHRFDQEKEAAGKQIHSLLEENAGPDEMNRAVGEFTEMYSDYGRNRQQELSFHLEQLQR